ncbi:MAG: oligosaccharide flippase family protein, partial [Clostridia bacterium]|nr:oligosaccharide flippase family protein [Clostridia bacterium]
MILSGTFVLSTLSRYQNDDENFNKTYWTFFRYTSMLLFPMGVGVFVYRGLAQTILLGAQWEEAALFLGISALANGFTIPLTYLPSEIYRSKGNPKLSMFYQVVLVICIVPIVLFSSKLGFTFLY